MYPSDRYSKQEAPSERWHSRAGITQKKAQIFILQLPKMESRLTLFPSLRENNKKSPQKPIRLAIASFFYVASEKALKTVFI